MGIRRIQTELMGNFPDSLKTGGGDAAEDIALIDVGAVHKRPGTRESEVRLTRIRSRSISRQSRA